MQHKITNLNNKKNYEFEFDKKNVMDVYLDGKLIMKCEYCILGMYNIELSVWYWSWNIAFINKFLIEKPIEHIKGFLNEINDNYDKFKKDDAEMLHYLLSNGNFYIANNKIDKIIKLGLYLTESIWYFPIKQEGERVQYVLVTKVLQY
jgi:hypothetical protein